MLLLFILGILLIVLCTVKVLRRHSRQQYAVLLVACEWPAERLEQALFVFAERCAGDFRHWYVYLALGSQAKSGMTSWQIASILAERWGFSLLSAGECRRLKKSNNCQYYFLSAAGELYHYQSESEKGWQLLFVL